MSKPARRYIPGTRIVDLTNLQFGRLAALEHVGFDKQGKALWRCRCSCDGRQVVVQGTRLRTGKTLSCGCYHREQSAARRRTHGQSGTRLHVIWQSMIQRCTDPRSKSYANYGGRGITVYPEWRESFEAFARDVTDGFDPRLEIDRIDNSRGYEPGNVRWIPHVANQRNKRNNRLVTFRGQTKALAEWAELLGMKAGTIQWRLSHGWTPQRALTTGADPDALARLSDPQSD
ncbi:hypothetical protein ACF061_00450 [Streptomyces sp. NPDC015220]|uniref:hypothetical protein n=1 Tax=Streptomyces sp. NPDC015220 TaxID=3364947 RepID=UPI003702AF00